MNKFVFFALFFMAIGSWQAWTQKNNVKFDHLSIKEGLSQTTINCILQDSKGFMWFGTQDGLNKYDGYDFTVYRNDPEVPNGLNHNFVSAIIEDQTGIIWIGTSGNGLNRLDPGTGIYKHYVHEPQDLNSLSHNLVSKICEASSGDLWIGTRGGGLNRFDPKTGSFTHYCHHPEKPLSLSNNFILSIHEDHNKTIRIGTRNGLNKFDAASGSFTRYFHDSQNPENPSHREVTTICEDRSGTLWFGTDGGGFSKFIPRTGTFKHYMHDPKNSNSLSHNSINVIYEDRSGMLWIGTEGGGLNRFNPQTGRFIHYRHEAHNPRSLNEDFVRSIHEDHTGILWIGTLSGGINKLDPRTTVFSFYTHHPQNSNSLSSSNISGICEDRTGVLWIGTSKGLNTYDPVTEKFDVYEHDPNNPKSLSHNGVYSICEDRSGILWIGTRKGLNKFIRKNGTFKHYVYNPRKPTPNSISCNFITEMIAGRSGGLWVGTNRGGLNKFDPKTETFTSYMHHPGNPSSLSHNSIYSLYEDRSGTLWVGGPQGLNKRDPRGNTFQHYVHNPKDPGSLSRNKVMCIYEDRSGTLWVGTLGGGLNLFDPKRKTFKHYRKKQGLLNEVVYGILEDNNGNLWLSTNLGLFCFNPRTELFTHYDERDGLQSNEFNNRAYHKGSSGRLYFGGINGLNAFYADEVIRNSYAPPVVITGFQTFNKEVKLDRPITEITELNLSYKDYVFSFEFSALDFAAPGKNQYAYKMEGFDKGWLFTDSKKRFATYTNLGPGVYTFRVKGSNNHGAWNEAGAALKIRIIPPYWKTPWFKISLGIFILLVISLFYRMRIRTIKAQKNKLEALVDERTNDLKTKKEELEKINHIVKVISSEVDLTDLLNSILREAFVFKGVKKAYALVYDDVLKAYRYKACIGEDPGKRGHAEWLQEEVEAKYLKPAQEILDDLFLTYPGQTHTQTGQNKGSDLTIRIQVKNNVVGYLIFSNLEDRYVLESQGIHLLTNLKDHIVSAFIRSKLLLELKNANERAERERHAAEEANQSKSDFLARMSHEIRTPMNSVIGFTEMLMDTELNDEQLDYARTINRSGELLLTLLNDILDFSKIESGQLTLETIHFDPEVLAYDVCELIRPRIGLKPIEILCRIGDKVPSNVKGDPGKYRQVLINLLGNAVKFTNKGEIELEIDVDEEDQTTVTLHAIVKDTGVGIPKDKLESVFNIFQQADGSTTRKYGGSGLGLAICKQISMLMGGDVWGESEPGKGSTFHFTAVMEKSEKKPVKPTTPESLTGKRVLIVDDNRSNLDILTLLLSSAGMEVVTLNRGADVIPMLIIGNKTRSPFDLCILDIQMPDISGYEVARMIREPNSPNPNLPLLAFTSSFSRKAKDLKDAGFDGFLPKPIQKAKLIEMLAQILGKSKIETDTRKNKGMLTRHSIIDEVKQSTRILLAEDNPINQKLANFILTKAGYQVEVVNNGKQALETYTANPDKFDMIFMDVQMPEMDGIEASMKIRELGLNDIPIIAMTAQAVKGDREKCMEAGMSDYMAKPIKRERVFEMVKKWTFGKKEQKK